MSRNLLLCCIILSSHCTACITYKLAESREDGSQFTNEFNRYSTGKNVLHQGVELEPKVIDAVRYKRYQFEGLLHDEQRTLEIRLAEDGDERSHVLEVARPEEGRPAWLVSIEDWNDDTHQLFFDLEKGDFVDPLVFASKAFPEPIPTPQKRVAFLRMEVVPAHIAVQLVVFEALPSGQWLVVDTAWNYIEPDRIEVDWDERSYPGWIASAFAYGLTVPLDIVTSPFQLIGLIVYAGAAWQ